MNPINWLSSYFRGVQAEMRKVVWPTFPVLMHHFISVVIGVALAIAFIGAVDYVFLHLLSYFFK